MLDLPQRKHDNRSQPARTASALTRALVAEIDRRKLRYTDVCVRAGMHLNYLSDYKHGKRDMKVMELEAIVEILGGSITVTFP